jgi:malate dehydrogenase (oxaloacetate-decarboxylating)
MRSQLEGHLMDVNRTADYSYDREKMKDAIDLVVVTDSEAILGIGGEPSLFLSL